MLTHKTLTTNTELNKMFASFGYMVFPHRDNDNSNVWNLYNTKGEYGLDYVCSFEPDIDGHSFFITSTNVPDMEKEVSSVNELIDVVTKHNAKRAIPMFCYDPEVRPFGNLERAFGWYMKTLGFVHPDFGEYLSYGHSYTMILRNMYGEPISHITMTIDDLDKDTGSIIRTINNKLAWVESKFKGVDEMIASVNSMLEPEMLINASKEIVVSNNLTEDRSDNISFNKIDDSMNMYKINAKNALKSALTQALENLND